VRALRKRKRDNLIGWMRIVCSGQRSQPDSRITEMARDPQARASLRR
jgi:hypothetical protein